MTKVKVIMNYDNNKVEYIEVDLVRPDYESEEQENEFRDKVNQFVIKKYGIYDVKEFVILND